MLTGVTGLGIPPQMYQQPVQHFGGMYPGPQQPQQLQMQQYQMQQMQLQQMQMQMQVCIISDHLSAVHCMMSIA